jgi:hypothetical protein
LYSLQESEDLFGESYLTHREEILNRMVFEISHDAGTKRGNALDARLQPDHVHEEAH